MNLTTFASRATAALVAAVAGFASYRHIVRVATTAGEHPSVAAVLPLAIDGLILVATLAMLEDKRNNRHPRTSARFALAFGIVATLGANIASAQPTWTARAVAAVPAISFLIAVEVLARRGRQRVTEPATALATVRATVVPEQADVRTQKMREPGPAADPWTWSEPVTAAAAEPVREPVREPVQRRRVIPRSLTAAQRVAAAHTKDPDATHERIADLAKVSVSTVKRHRPARVSGSPSGPGAAETAAVNGRATELVEVLTGDR